MCLLVVFVVVAYDVLVIQPFSDKTSVPTTRYTGTGDSLLLLTKPWSVLIVGVLVQRLVTYTLSFVGQGQTADIQNYATQVYITSISSEGRGVNLICLGSISFQCPLVSEHDPDVTFGELFIGTNFTASVQALTNGTDLKKDLHGNLGPLMIQLRYGTDPFGDLFPLFPNVHIRATLAVKHMQSVTSEKIAATGLQAVGRDVQNIFHHRSLHVQFRDSYTFNIDKVFPDPDPPISGEILSSLRIFIPSDSSMLYGSHKIEKEVKEFSILTGTSILGGLWTFMTGIFSLIFGSSLLLVLFGEPSLSLL